ncbi:hypothetical protein I4U23_021244 [Adineta vaga]|nr:hypothetical protein I4U23_021244 [Adineta vaga]
MLTTTDTDNLAEFREKHAFSPNILSLTFPNENFTNNQQLSHSPSAKLHFHRQQRRPMTSYTVRSNSNTYNLQNSTLLSYTWLRKYERVDPIVPAPDLLYRYSHLEAPKRKKTTPMSHSFSFSTRPISQPPVRPKTAISLSRQSPSVYDSILHSFRETQRERYRKQENFPTHIKRPLNNDIILQRALSPKRYPTCVKQILSSKEDFRHIQTMNTYITQSIDETRPSTPDEFNI